MPDTTEPTAEQIEYAAIAMQCEAEVRNLVAVMPWSGLPEEYQDHYRAFAKAAIGAFLEGPEVAQAVADVYAELTAGATT